MQFAAQDVRRQLLAIAASQLEANPNDLEIANKRVFVKGSPDRGIGFAALARAALSSPAGGIVGTGAREREEWMARQKQLGAIAGETQLGIQVALVEVDTETGRVSVLAYVAAQDAGFALNPVQAHGQLQGGVLLGLGFALGEEIVQDEGRVANPNFADYLLPAADVSSPIHTILVEQPCEAGPFGARGMGEAPVGAVALAIANAIYHAVGVRIRDLPITPEKVLKALKEREQRADSIDAPDGRCGRLLA